MTRHRNLTVFVSSTSEDLKEYRAVARNVILDMHWRPEMMEHFGTSPQPTITACRDVLRICDLVLLIVAFRRGWVPTLEQGGDGVNSITAHELQYARELNIPVLAFLASESWPGNLWEDDDEARKWVKKFRDDLNLLTVFFDYEPTTTKESERLPAFRSKVREALVSHRERLPTNQRTSLGSVSGLDYFESALGGIVEGSSIPFLGSGVFGNGPLSPYALSRALCEEKDCEEMTLATAAEYRERYLGSRERFLKQFRQVLEYQGQEAPCSPVHDMVVQMEKPSLIVSASCDQVLEARLAADGKPCVIVSHIIRSFDGEHDGKILVLQTGEPPKICLADKVDLHVTECIIYKPLGSPFLHDGLDPDLEIDTVVVTETDHLTFLGRLENQHTQIPAVFSRLFRRCALLFLGYTLDVWHYRLVMQVFQSVGARGIRASTLAVRQPASPMEDLAWQRLGADLIPMDPNDFARRVLPDIQRKQSIEVI